ncbi:MAG: paraquat-inducible membrane protein A [Deltaproteobacteria bacterium]|nr:MAG: paraquat-inducible membrane protein A [Deltaproteobacteria bacterium]
MEKNGTMGKMNTINYNTAKDLSLVSCEICNSLYDINSFKDQEKAKCHVCGLELHQRKPNSISRTWALLLTSAICYIPANIYPVMVIDTFGNVEAHTIISGVIAFIHSKDYPLALLVFFASIFIPIMKMLSLMILLISVQFEWKWGPGQRNTIYKIVEFIGKWSMVDIFMISILMALVKLGTIVTIVAGKGATFFGLVVFFTMIAASTFDVRLVWDNAVIKDK